MWSTEKTRIHIGTAKVNACTAAFNSRQKLRRGQVSLRRILAPRVGLMRVCDHPQQTILSIDEEKAHLDISGRAGFDETSCMKVEQQFTVFRSTFADDRVKRSAPTNSDNFF